MSFLQVVNVFFLQWFFIRLARCSENRIVSFDLHEVSLMIDGNVGMGGAVEIEKYQWYSIIFWIVPTTGWWNDFIIIGKKMHNVRITKKTRQP